MKRAKLLLLSVLSLGIIAVSALITDTARSEGKLEIEGDVMTTHAAGPKGHPLKEIISGWEFRKKATQELEADDFQNPGMLWVEEGEELWDTVDGTEGKACATCHEQASVSMKTVGNTFPKWNDALKKPISLEGQINRCRTQNMGAKEWKRESNQLLSMTVFVRNQSRGQAMKTDVTGPMSPWFDKGKKLYYTRFGQLDMACANCHEDYYGKNIRADLLSQGQSNGFPTYRLKWQKVGSIHRRFKGCMKQVRAKPFKVGGDEFLALEVYLAWRGQGLSVETPAVRN